MPVTWCKSTPEEKKELQGLTLISVGRTSSIVTPDPDDAPTPGDESAESKPDSKD